jgi:hypothetical protein
VTVHGLPASEYFNLLCDDKGLPFSTAHALAREHNDQCLDDLPCRGESECPAIAQWEGIPRDDDGEPAVDVVHATHPFAYVPSLRAHTNVVLDEQPDFRVDVDDLGQDRIRRMVNAYLQEIDAPVSTWEAFIYLAEVEGGRSDAAAERDALDDKIGEEPRREWYLEEPDAHAFAPDLAKAIWNALRWEDPDANGRRSTKVMHEPPRLDDSEGYAGTWLSVVIDAENTVRQIRNVPDFTQARSVIGLDAHPSMPIWQLNTGPMSMTRDAVLETEERRLWRRYERGLTVVQVGDATRPRSGLKAKAMEWFNRERVAAVVHRIREHSGADLSTAVTTAQVESAVGSVLGRGGHDSETMHYGEEKSRNDFASESVGYLYGCMDPGDEMILDALAELGLEAQPAMAERDDGEIVREKGRTFVGPDADVAGEVLASVRENHVAQGAGRYARQPGQPDSGAVVYVHTNAAPPGLVDVEAPGVEWLASETQQAIIRELTIRPSATARELADGVGCSKEHVRETLARLEERDYPLVRRLHGAGEHGADVYQDRGAAEALVDLGETANDPLCSPNRWSLAIRVPNRRDRGVGRATRDSPAPTRAETGGDRPPDEAD